MRASLLLLFVFCHYSSASGINWEECGDGKTAFCRASLCTFDANGEGELTEYKHVQQNKKCDLGFHIKPESKTKWTISMVMDNQNKPLFWKIEEKDIFKCNQNSASLVNDDGKLRLTNLGASTPTSHSFCVFTVQSQGDTIARVLEGFKTEDGSTYTSLSDNDGKSVQGHVDYKIVERRIPCRKEDVPYDEKTCEKDEDCTELTNSSNVNVWGCKSAAYDAMFRKDDNSNFTKAKFGCAGGKLSAIIEMGAENIKESITGDSKTKCARKKCSLCVKPMISKGAKHYPSAHPGECAILNCTNGYMVLNIIKAGEKISLATADNVQCSAKTKDTVKKNSRWVVDDDDEVEIESAECRDSVNCDLLANNKIDAKCKETDENCNPAVLQASGEYTCRNGTMHVEANKTNVRIDQPKCEADGTWKITLHTANSSTTVMWGKGTPLNIKCILDPVAKSVEAPVEGGSQTWLIILMVVLFLFVVAVAVGVFCFFKRKNKKKPAPTPSKTSSSTTSKDTLKKLSSSENEPMTSAIKSTTGESIKTAVEQKPAVAPAVAPVLANVDLREQTATSPDSSPKKEKKSDPKPAKKEEKKSVKKSKEDTWDASYGKPSDETSKNQDVTSTKEKVALLPKSAEDPKSQTGGDGESQVENNKKGENAKLLPKGTPRKYTKSSTKAQAPKNPNTAFINVTDSDDEPSQTGSKKKKNKRR